ncbi:MAG: hypothetical protein Q4P71_03415 [Actinomycetaceae bacterium]|nr:hypothetical protein [Actinomycetaceae bacterium]
MSHLALERDLGSDSSPLQTLSDRNRRIRLAIVFFVTGFHIFRNLSLSVYMMIFGLIALMTMVDYLSSRSISRRTAGHYVSIMTIWLFFIAIGFISSIGQTSTAGLITGTTRLLFWIPFGVALMTYIRDQDDFHFLLKLLVVYWAINSLSILVQFAIGPIPFFANESLRAGFTRYAPLSGALPTISSFGMVPVLAVPIASPLISFLIVIGFIGSIASLSKAAIAIGFLGTTYYFFRTIKSINLLTWISVAILGVLTWALLQIQDIWNRLAAVLLSFGIETEGSSTIQNWDVSVERGALERITTLPEGTLKSLYEANVDLFPLLGGGYGYASTALVPNNDSLAVMAHNQYVEVWAVFGVFGMLVFGIIVLLTLINLTRIAVADSKSVHMLLAAIIFFISAIFANGTIYQPVHATIFAIILFAAFAPPETCFGVNGRTSTIEVS